MRLSVRAVLVLLLVFGFSSIVAGTSVGTAPGSLNLGELQPGQSYEGFFYVTTRGISQEFSVEPEYRMASRSLFEREVDGEAEDVEFYPDQASQQDISEWISFSQETYRVDPNERNIADMEGGGSIVYNERIRFVVNLPDDAEPGFHAGSIDLNPDLQRSGSGGSSVMNLGVTRPTFFFEVPGHAERKVDVVDVRAVRTGNEEARIDFLVSNEGTVTSWLRRSDTTVYDKVGDESNTITTGGRYVSPDTTEVISTMWRNPELEGGQYRVSGELDFITGKSYVDETINISDTIQVEREEREDGYRPTWVILMLLLLVGVLMYSFEIDPVYIFALLGFGAISVFILSVTISNWVIALLLFIIVGVFYAA